MSAVEIACPTCRKRTVWDETILWRPFCSERCQLIDLGAWADESYQISGESLSNMPEDDHSS